MQPGSSTDDVPARLLRHVEAVANVLRHRPPEPTSSAPEQTNSAEPIWPCLWVPKRKPKSRKQQQRAKYRERKFIQLQLELLLGEQQTQQDPQLLQQTLLELQEQ
jgi:hypothetical protein